MRDAVRRVGRPVDAQLRHSGDPDDHCPGSAQAPDDLVVLVLGPGISAGRADPHRLTGDRDVVLDGDGNPRERQLEPVGSRVDGIGLGERLLRPHDLVGAHPVVDTRDAFECLLGRCSRGEVAGPHVASSLGGGANAGVAGLLGHAATLPLPRPALSP